MLAGSDVIICADADSAVGRFRGADPDGLSAALDPYRAKEIVLNSAFRNSSSIFDVGVRFAKSMKGSPVTRKRTCSNENEGQVQVHRFRSGAEEAAFIAHQFRSAHLREGISYSNMAVILRSPGMQASSLRRAFSQVGIPVASELQALAGNPAIAPFFRFPCAEYVEHSLLLVLMVMIELEHSYSLQPLILESCLLKVQLR
jgi:superfamily I DNA/RNA helicase